jgi:hypothetical protein
MDQPVGIMDGETTRTAYTRYCACAARCLRCSCRPRGGRRRQPSLVTR